MALIKCPKCGREISDKAENCIGCGWKVEAIKDSKKEQTTKLQHTVAMKREKKFPSANILFMIVLTFVLICFMIVVWRKLDEFEKEIELLISERQIESDTSVDHVENPSDEMPDTIATEDIQDVIENINSDSDIETDSNEENDSIIQVTFDSCNPVGNIYTELIFTIKNISEEDISISVDEYQYMNDVAVKGLREYSSDIPKGKAAVVKFTFRKSDVVFRDINRIEFCCKSLDKTNEETEHTFLFDNLNVHIE